MVSTLDELHKNTIGLKLLERWELTYYNNRMNMTLTESDERIPKFELIFDDSLAFHVVHYGWKLPDMHPIYKTYKRMTQNVTPSSLAAILTLLFRVETEYCQSPWELH